MVAARHTQGLVLLAQAVPRVPGVAPRWQVFGKPLQALKLRAFALLAGTCQSPTQQTTAQCP